MALAQVIEGLMLGFLYIFHTCSFLTHRHMLLCFYIFGRYQIRKILMQIGTMTSNEAEVVEQDSKQNPSSAP